MKFTEIADGEQFEFKGMTYTKHGPLMAVDETGASKMLPRSAEVLPVSTNEPQKPSFDCNNDMKVLKVINTFETFYVQCQACFKELETKVDTGTLKEIKSRLEQARQAFIEKLTQ